MAIVFSMLTDSPQNSGFLYGSFEARHRFDDLTITGTTLKPVPGVDVQKDQVSFTMGGVYFMDSFGVGFSVTGFSRSFKQDKKRKHYR
ncbi:MAG: lipid A-modifier LpxR family protein, partial [Endozoicomonas sp.]